MNKNAIYIASSVAIVTMLAIFLYAYYSQQQPTPSSKYTSSNTAYVSFDVSHPIDSSGYLLKGKNTKGGTIHFHDKGTQITSLLIHEDGDITLPTITNDTGKPLINTDINYQAIKFINPNNINNLFIKIGIANRTQTVSGLDPNVLKDGKYTWQVPILAYGVEQNNVDSTSDNMQFIQIGGQNSPASNNDMYTQDVYVYARGKSNSPIIAHPIKLDQSQDILANKVTENFSCTADGLWGAGRSAPYRRVTGKCKGSADIYPAGPNLDYVFGNFQLPSIQTPWSASTSDQCTLNGKKKSGCTNAIINLNIKYMAQRIRTPLNEHITLFAEFGTAYRNINPDNLRYNCDNNIYVKAIVPNTSCYTKNFLPGGGAYTLFAVGYEVTTNNGTHVSARFINIPGQENANQITWNDAANTQIYAITANQNTEKTMSTLKKALSEIATHPDLNMVLVKYYFSKIIEANTQATN